MQMYCAGKWDVDQMIRTMTILRQTQTRDINDIESNCFELCKGEEYYDNCKQPCNEGCDDCYRDEDCSCYCTGCKKPNDEHCDCDEHCYCEEYCENCDCDKECRIKCDVDSLTSRCWNITSAEVSTSTDNSR